MIVKIVTSNPCRVTMSQLIAVIVTLIFQLVKKNVKLSIYQAGGNVSQIYSDSRPTGLPDSLRKFVLVLV